MAEWYYEQQLSSFVDDVHAIRRAVLYHEGLPDALAVLAEGSSYSNRSRPESLASPSEPKEINPRLAFQHMVNGLTKRNEAEDDLWYREQKEELKLDLLARSYIDLRAWSLAHCRHMLLAVCP